MKYYIHNLNHQYIGKSFDSPSENEAYDIAWNLFGLNCCDDFLIFTEINKVNSAPNERYLIHQSGLNEFEKDVEDYY